MPRVRTSEAEEQRRFLGSVIKANMQRREVDCDSLMKRTGIKKSTHYRRIREPDTMTVGELKKYIKVLGISDEDLIYCLKGGEKPC